MTSCCHRRVNSVSRATKNKDEIRFGKNITNGSGDAISCIYTGRRGAIAKNEEQGENVKVSSKLKCFKK